VFLASQLRESDLRCRPSIRAGRFTANCRPLEIRRLIELPIQIGALVNDLHSYDYGPMKHLCRDKGQGEDSDVVFLAELLGPRCNLFGC